MASVRYMRASDEHRQRIAGILREAHGRPHRRPSRLRDGGRVARRPDRSRERMAGCLLAFLAVLLPLLSGRARAGAENDAMRGR
jgi:hypothetical protein